LSNFDQRPVEFRRLLASLQDGMDISEPALYQNSLAQSDYSVIFTSNASELVDNTAMTDFAVPGALYMIRHGLELWLKCILANRDLDRLLKLITQEDLSFDDLCAHDVMTAGRTVRLQNANAAALRRGLCIMRNVLEDGLRYPECRHKRMETRYADRALTFLRRNPSTPRKRLGVLYVPLIGGHELFRLWEQAEPYIHDLRRGAQHHAEDVGGGAPLELGHTKELCAFLHHLDPDGDALRYPFSLTGGWHDHQLRLSLKSVGKLARELTESTRSYTGYRGEVYVHTTVSDPMGPLYLGGI
jgi:hypothetical protein